MVMRNLMRTESKKCLIRAIDKGIGRCISDSGRLATIYSLEERSMMRLSQIFEEPELFVSVMRQVFGTGADLLLGSILTELGKVVHENEDMQSYVADFMAATDASHRPAGDSGRLEGSKTLGSF